MTTPRLSLKRDGVLAIWPDGQCAFLTLRECVGLYFGRAPKQTRYPSYCCQRCGEWVGWLGRALNPILRLHQCGPDKSYSRLHWWAGSDIVAPFGEADIPFLRRMQKKMVRAKYLSEDKPND